MDGNVTDFNGCWELESDLPNMAPVTSSTLDPAPQTILLLF